MNNSDTVVETVDDFTFVFKKAIQECITRGVDLTFYDMDTNEFENMIIETFIEEAIRCREIVGRDPSYDEVISIFIEKITEYSRQHSYT